MDDDDYLVDQDDTPADGDIPAKGVIDVKKVRKVGPLPANVLKDKDRVTSQFRCYYEHRGDEPVMVQHAYSGFAATSEQPYKRRHVITDVWQPLDLGWMPPEGVGDIIIFNIANPALAMPEAERLLEESKVLLISSDKAAPKKLEGAWRVRAGKMFFAEPVVAGNIWVRAHTVPVTITVHLIPR